jgi:radical SAM superfamily enzyme YgiQ (UPF0313 family)
MYEQGVIRPPSEAWSLLVRATRTCPWNQCLFCPAYKGTKFSRRSVAEIKADIDAMAREYGKNIHMIKTAFLQDADSLILKTEQILEILRHLKARFPGIERVTTYARANTLRCRGWSRTGRMGSIATSRDSSHICSLSPRLKKNGIDHIFRHSA